MTRRYMHKKTGQIRDSKQHHRILEIFEGLIIMFESGREEAKEFYCRYFLKKPLKDVNQDEEIKEAKEVLLRNKKEWIEVDNAIYFPNQNKGVNND